MRLDSIWAVLDSSIWAYLSPQMVQEMIHLLLVFSVLSKMIENEKRKFGLCQLTQMIHEIKD
jgi:hypothetical protein